MSKSITRRTFIKSTSSAAIAGSLYLNSPVNLFAKNDNKSKVVLIRDENVLNSSGDPKKPNLAKMLDEAVSILTNEKNPIQGWQNIIKAEDIVGIKSNVYSYLRTPVELEELIQDRIEKCGVSSSNISVGDRAVLDDPVFQNSTALINTRPMRDMPGPGWEAF